MKIGGETPEEIAVSIVAELIKVRTEGKKSRESYNITALILAAGYSSRMGSFKPLLSFNGVCALERVTALFKEVGIEDIRVVLGYRAEELLLWSSNGEPRRLSIIAMTRNVFFHCCRNRDAGQGSGGVLYHARRCTPGAIANHSRGSPIPMKNGDDCLSRL